MMRIVIFVKQSSSKSNYLVKIFFKLEFVREWDFFFFGSRKQNNSLGGEGGTIF